VRWPSLLLCGLVLVGAACGNHDSRTSPTPTSGPVASQTLVGAGDIAGYPGSGKLSDTEATAKLLGGIPGIVFTAGDNINSIEPGVTYQTAYAATWGRFLDRTFPSPGNHDYDVRSGASYFTYFGSQAGPSGLGYYSYPAGVWHVISLNSEVEAGAGSAQYRWLVDDLETNRAPCTAAYWHTPAFTSGPSPPTQSALDLWKVMASYGVEIVVNGHNHQYERFAPMGANGIRDNAAGVREFVVGTGGAVQYPFGAVMPNSEVRGNGFGVLKLTLSQGSYTWEFVPTPGSSLRDSGSGVCH